MKGLLNYLQWNIGVDLELLDELGPWLEFLRLVIDVVIEHGALVGKFDAFELGCPPSRKFHSVISYLLIKKINKINLPIIF